MPEKQGQVQLGKQGISENFIKTLKNHFKKCRNVRISVLKNVCRDRKEIKKIRERILEELGKNYSARIIGYTIALKKQHSKNL